MGRHRLYASATERQRAHRAKVRQCLRTQTLTAFPSVTIGSCTLYQGDSAQILPLLTGLDVLVTDPPYGVLTTPDAQGRATRGTGGKHGLIRMAYASYEDTYANFCQVVVPILTASLAKVVRGAVFTGPHVQEQRKATAIGGVYCPAGVGRHAWGWKEAHPVLYYGTQPRLHEGAQPNTITSTERAEPNGHVARQSPFAAPAARPWATSNSTML